MTKSKLLSAALIAAAMLATPAMARTNHVTSRHLAADANASTSELFGEVDRTGRGDPVGTGFIFSNLLVADANQRAELDLRHPPRCPVMV